MGKVLENYALKALKMNENPETGYISRPEITKPVEAKGICRHLPINWRSSPHSPSRFPPEEFVALQTGNSEAESTNQLAPVKRVGITSPGNRAGLSLVKVELS